MKSTTSNPVWRFIDWGLENHTTAMYVWPIILVVGGIFVSTFGYWDLGLACLQSDPPPGYVILSNGSKWDWSTEQLREHFVSTYPTRHGAVAGAWRSYQKNPESWKVVNP
jgi:hypothetical protein